MAVAMFCELCGKEMGRVSFKELKKFSQKKEETCKDCVDMQNNLKVFVEKQRGIISKRTNDLINEMTKIMDEKVTGLINSRRELEIEEIRKDIIKDKKMEE